jgi:hypothetical protein
MVGLSVLSKLLDNLLQLCISSESALQRKSLFGFLCKQLFIVVRVKFGIDGVIFLSGVLNFSKGLQSSNSDNFLVVKSLGLQISSEVAVLGNVRSAPGLLLAECVMSAIENFMQNVGSLALPHYNEGSSVDVVTHAELVHYVVLLKLLLVDQFLCQTLQVHVHSVSGNVRMDEVCFQTASF